MTFMDQLRARACWAIVLATLDALHKGITPEQLREAARVGMEDAE